MSVPEDPVELPIEDSLDLHAFAPKDVRDLVASYLDEAHGKGFREVRVIHGRGTGVQREIVRSVLARHPKVLTYADVEPARGGWGATIVRLAAPGDAVGQ
jgi:dsDNA-specific endonuclease/ATPase MutS2